MPPVDLPAGDNSWYQLVTTKTGDPCLQLTGSYTLVSLNQSLPAVARELTQLASRPDLHWDLTNIHRLDYAGAVMLWRAWNGQRPDCLSLRPEQERMFLRLEKTISLPEPVQRKWFLPISMLGQQLLRFPDRAGYSLFDYSPRQDSCSGNFCKFVSDWCPGAWYYGNRRISDRHCAELSFI